MTYDPILVPFLRDDEDFLRFGIWIEFGKLFFNYYEIKHLDLT